MPVLRLSLDVVQPAVLVYVAVGGGRLEREKVKEKNFSVFPR